MDIDPTVKSVVVGTDFYMNFKKIALAAKYINVNGAQLISKNIDRNDGKKRLRPSFSAIVRLIETAASIGKFYQGYLIKTICSKNKLFSWVSQTDGASS